MFLVKEVDWLNIGLQDCLDLGSGKIPSTKDSSTETFKESKTASTQTFKRSKPADTPFSDLTSRSKYRKTLSARKNPDFIKFILDKSNNNGACKTANPEEVLQLLKVTNMSMRKYKELRLFCLKNGCTLFPKSDIINSAKAKCYPKNLVVTESKASVPLFDLCDNTINRLCEVDQVQKYLETNKNIETSATYKAGGYGQGLQSQYHQKSSKKPVHEKSLYTQAVVLLKFTDLTNNKVIYENKEANSKHHTRILHREYANSS